MTTTTTTTTVTEAQLAACHRIEDDATKTVFYQVESATEPDTEYTVRRFKNAYTCTCKAGQRGNACWHRRAALAHAQEYKAEQVKAAHIEKLMAMGLTMEEAKQAANAVLIVDGKPADDETLVRVFGPATQRPTEAEIERDARRYASIYNKPFSLLK